MRNFCPISKWPFQQRSKCARGLLLLLCLATWRGPIPWIHAHGSEDVANEELERHLLSYHRGHLNQKFFNWHLHLMLPWERFDCHDGSDPEQSPPDPLTRDGVVIVALNCGEIAAGLSSAHARGSFLDQNLWEMVWSHHELRGHLDEPKFSSFSESLLLTAPMCAVTGVALC